MSRILSFHFEWRNTLVHRMDDRPRMLLFMGLQIIAGTATWLHLAMMAAVLGGLVILSRAPWSRVMLPFRHVWVFLFMIMVLRALPFDPADSAWQDGMLEGLRLCAQMVLMLAFVQLMFETTSIQGIRHCMTWIFSPFPPKLSWALGLSTSLVFLFVPLLFDAARDKRLSLENRGFRPTWRRPILYLRALQAETAGLLEQAFMKADDVSLSMRARHLAKAPEHPSPVDFPVSGPLGPLAQTMLVLVFLSALVSLRLVLP